MACGTPVITSNTSSMPEVAGDAAYLIDPNKTEEISQGILRIMSDKTFKNELIQKGLKRSKQFTWNNTALKVLKQYKDLYKEINS